MKKRKIILPILALGVLATSLTTSTALYQSSGVDVLTLRTGSYSNIITYELEAEEKLWMPGQTRMINASVENTGDIQITARAKISESWINDKGQSLPLIDEDGNQTVMINANKKWKYNEADGYYYYNGNALIKGESTTSVVDSIQLNKDIHPNITVQIDDHVITTITNEGGYENAQYRIRIEIETIDAEYANSYWGI